MVQEMHLRVLLTEKWTAMTLTNFVIARSLDYIKAMKSHW